MCAEQQIAGTSDIFRTKTENWRRLAKTTRELLLATVLPSHQGCDRLQARVKAPAHGKFVTSRAASSCYIR
jgi:hypothetical protein